MLISEDFDLAYRSILPLEVYGDKDKPLTPAHCKEALQVITIKFFITFKFQFIDNQNIFNVLYPYFIYGSDLQECVRVTQMTFDVEHYLEEVIGHFADWGHRYIAFTNYDLQILDVRHLKLFLLK